MTAKSQAQSGQTYALYTPEFGEEPEKDDSNHYRSLNSKKDDEEM